MSMAGSYGYAAPEILLQTGHSKPADMWSLGYLPTLIYFRNAN
jgi:calcium/calmodulin-dependent protein kinase I